MVELGGHLATNAGVAISGAAVAVFPTSVNATQATSTDCATTTTTTTSGGDWAVSCLAANTYDVRITCGSSVRWRRYVEEIQVTTYQLGDDGTAYFGAGNDAGIRWSDGDASNHALVVAVGDTSQQIHITDLAAIGTDWTRSAGTHPELAIHSNTCPITDYLAIGNHNGTTASIDVVGGTTLSFAIAGNSEASITASGLTLPANSDLLFTGGTGTNDIVLTNGLSDALSITDGSADVVVIDTSTSGNVITLTSALTVGSDGSGSDLILYSATAGDNLTWDASDKVLNITGTNAETALDVLDGDVRIVDKLYFYDRGGEYLSSDGSTLAITGATTVSSTLGVTGLLTAGSLDIDNVLIDGTTIGHTCDTDLLTLGNATLLAKGTVTVGVDGTGHDVTFYGDSPGAFMLYDQSEDMLEIRGATAAGPGHLKLTTGEATVVANDVLGKIEFQAPAECGTDAVKVSATIAAVAQGTFAACVNATDLILYTAHDCGVAERFRFTSQNEIGIAGANYGTDGYVLTSGGPGAAVAWEAAAGGGSLTLIETLLVGCPPPSSLIIGGITSTYDTYLVAFSDIMPVDDASGLQLRVGEVDAIDGGGTDYSHHSQSLSAASGSYYGCDDASNSHIVMTPNAVGNATGEGVGGYFWIHSPTDGAGFVYVTGQFSSTAASAVNYSGAFYGKRNAVIALEQFELKFSGGSVSRGRMTLWGLAHA